MMLISLRLDRAVVLLRPGQQGSPQNSYSYSVSGFVGQYRMDYTFA